MRDRALDPTLSAGVLPELGYHNQALPETRADDYVLGNFELPIAQYRAEIETAIVGNSVVILMAQTGAGKTSQVPQYARELTASDGTPFFDEIIATQPRIIAARTLSKRVANEIAQTDQADDHSVGYFTSKEGSVKPQSEQHIAFLTDGKAAAQLLHGNETTGDKKRLLIIDEVHEWNLHIELLVAAVRAKTDPSSTQYDKNLKVVIMSATMDGERLKQYFAVSRPPLITVDVPSYKIESSVSSEAVAALSLRLASETGKKVLTFVAGKSEIAAITDSIEKDQRSIDESVRVVVVPLHGQLTAEEQALAFVEYPKGSVIVTTNVAETSLTVPDVVAVIDSGEVRVDRVSYDLVPTGSEGLYLEPAAQANLMQRRGRTGRTRPGQYILGSQFGVVPPVSLEARPAYATPAIQRTSLDGMLLRIKAAGFEASDFNFFHKPPEVALLAASQRLTVLGAFNEKGEITKRGLAMERLPLDPELSCMVLFAYEKGYSSEVKQNVIDIAAIMQRGGIIKRSPKAQAWRSLLETNDIGETAEKDSDYFAQLEVYVELMQLTDREDWKKYDINEHAADLVNLDRENLANRLRIALQPPAVVQQHNRDKVLTCIHAGQLNQLWKQSEDGLSLLGGNGRSFELAASSIVKVVGGIVTGSLFSLGVNGQKFDAIQNVNALTQVSNLEQAAQHLIRDVPNLETATYDHSKNALVVRVQRKLGHVVLSTFMQVIESEEGSPETEKLRTSYGHHAWNIWPERRTQRPAYTSATIDDAIENPESMQFGSDPITGEPLMAWRGGKGQWIRSKEAAQNSLTAHKEQLAKRPAKDELFAIKAAVKVANRQLIALKKGKNTGIPASVIRAVLLRKTNTPEWLGEVVQLLSIN